MMGGANELGNGGHGVKTGTILIYRRTSWFLKSSSAKRMGCLEPDVFVGSWIWIDIPIMEEWPADAGKLMFCTKDPTQNTDQGVVFWQWQTRESWCCQGVFDPQMIEFGNVFPGEVEKSKKEMVLLFASEFLPIFSHKKGWTLQLHFLYANILLPKWTNPYLNSHVVFPEVYSASPLGAAELPDLDVSWPAWCDQKQTWKWWGMVGRSTWSLICIRQNLWSSAYADAEISDGFLRNHNSGEGDCHTSSLTRGMA